MTLCYNNGYYGGGYYSCNSGWYNWGRWVLLGVIILVAFFFFLGLSCLSARRRRRRGQQPFYGTGWTATGNYGTRYQQRPQTETTTNYNAGVGGYYGQNQGYFGGQQTGVEMQQPQQAYAGGQNVYQPPNMPPPGKR